MFDSSSTGYQAHKIFFGSTMTDLLLTVSKRGQAFKKPSSECPKNSTQSLRELCQHLQAKDTFVCRAIKSYEGD
jgi:hypothetical protein